jgi:hypothetical protein
VLVNPESRIDPFSSHYSETHGRQPQQPGRGHVNTGRQDNVDLTPWMPWFRLIHVLAALGFVLTHGASGMLALKLRGERDRARIEFVAQTSSSFLVWGWVALAVVLIGGLIQGIVGGFWTDGGLWLWASLVVFIVVGGLMTPLGASYMDEVRHAVGLPTYSDKRKKRTPPDPLPDDELARVLASPKPIWTATIGIGGIAILVWLMIMKPF